MWEKVAKKA